MGYRKLMKILQETGRLTHEIPISDDEVEEPLVNEKRAKTVRHIDDNVECDLSRENAGVVPSEVGNTKSVVASATILPIGLLDDKKTWLWILILIGVIITAYFLWRKYSKRKDVILPTNEKTKTSNGDTVKYFMDNYST